MRKSRAERDSALFSEIVDTIAHHVDNPEYVLEKCGYALPHLESAAILPSAFLKNPVVFMEATGLKKESEIWQKLMLLHFRLQL